MANKKFVFILLLLVLLSILLYVNGNTADQTSCPFPSKLKNYYDYNWESRNNEWKNIKSKTDYLVLSLSW